MKKLLFTLLFVAASAAQAGTVAAALNEKGGMIVLTDEPCPGADTALLAFTTNPGHAPSFGCWMFWRGAVHIMWAEIGEVIVYSVDSFRAPSSADQPI